MNFPSRSRIRTELLLLIYSKGGNLYQLRSADTYAPLADKFNIGAEERKIIQDELRKNGRAEPVWNNEVQWARKDLVIEGYVHAFAHHGVWRLTTNGVLHAQWLLKLREDVQVRLRAISGRA